MKPNKRKTFFSFSPFVGLVVLALLVTALSAKIGVRYARTGEPAQDTQRINLDHGERKEVVLKRICACESNWNPDSESRQFDEHGKPLEHKNKNGTSDWGACQINDYWWDKTAQRLSLDYKNNKEDNFLLARHILQVQGVHAWNWSVGCHGVK